MSHGIFNSFGMGDDADDDGACRLGSQKRWGGGDVWRVYGTFVVSWEWACGCRCFAAAEPVPLASVLQETSS